MRGAVLYGPHDIRFEDRETPKILDPNDAIIRISLTCVCGSDLWPCGWIEKGATMSTWSKDELERIARTDDLHISPFREDGTTYGTPTWIWSVAVDGALYLRAYNGRGSRWYQAAMRQKAGRITAAGMTRDVVFKPVDGPINDRIDDAYRAKYRGSPYLSPMIGERARSATVEVKPRESHDTR
ncbi:MAG TPA: DUF2255 family protein [Gemmataceae bacterium]|nr:DUF2255 family protein [Gemmataceae bacterium]